MADNGAPEVVVHLTRELAEFALKNCDSNIVLGLQSIQTGLVTSEDNVRALVKLIENFRALAKATRAGLDGANG